MRKILTSAQAKELDRITMTNQNISSYDLMERAVNVLFNKIRDLYDIANNHFVIFAGCGNNGGDALGIARKLTENKVDTKVYFCNFSKNITAECKTNLDKVKSAIILSNLNTQNIDIPNNSIIIEGLFGTGLNRSVHGDYAKVIDTINASNCEVVSIDIPSGLFGEDNTDNNGSIIKANATISIQDQPLSAFFAENATYYGNIHIVDIEHDANALSNLQTDFYCLDEASVSKMIKLRKPFDHKGTFGHALLVAGSYGMAGAAVLSSRACLKSGLGLLSVSIPERIGDILQISVPEAMLNFNFDRTRQTELTKYSAVGIGPGITTDEYAKERVGYFATRAMPKVIDADGLNTIAKYYPNEKEEFFTANTIITPHPKEFERLFGNFLSSYERLKFMQIYSNMTGCVIVLKGGVTAISVPNNKVILYIGKNPGIATAGSGDVLTGIILSLLAQGYSTEEAAIIGVYVHGEAGKQASEELGNISVIASNIIDNLPLIFKRIYQQKERQKM